ncbi:MAG: S-layer homology domain-containing protein [Firmicutes bacterium]|nr:S-layer homology domain-containing protein [Bacillota bacterium]
MKRYIAVVVVLVMIMIVPAVTAVRSLAANSTGFSDVPENAWYAEAVEYVRSRGLMVGTSGTRFSPNSSFTRAQLAMVLYRIAGMPEVSGTDSFADTREGLWYTDAVLWAQQNGIVEGISPTRFGTDVPVSQEQLATMLWRMEGEPEAEEAVGTSEYAAKAVGWAKENGIIVDSLNFSFTPLSNALRGQVAGLIANYVDWKDAKSAEAEIIVLTVAGRELDVEWAANSSVEALKELLKEGSITLDMSDYGGFEKGAALPKSLPQNKKQMHTDAGDIILYQDKQFVIYYDTNSWSLTPLGKIQGMTKEELQELLGEGNVQAELKLGR